MEIKKAGVFPPNSIAGLYLQSGLYFMETFCVNVFFGGIPYLLKVSDLSDSIVVVIAELVP